MQPLIIDSSSIRISESKLLVSNLPPITPTPTQGFDVNNNQWLASSFQAGTSSYGYILNTVTLLFRLKPDTPVDPGSLFLRLHSDAGGDPGTAISSFNVPTIVSTGQYNFTMTNPPLLYAGITYWLIAGTQGSSVGTYLWAYTSSTTETGLTGWSLGNLGLYSANQGVSWFSLPGGGLFQFSITGAELL